MDFSPTPLQTLFLFRLLFAPEAPALSKTQPSLSPAQRKPLVDNGLIEIVPGVNPQTQRRASFVHLTDKAWEWAGQNLCADFPLSINGARALKDLLGRLDGYLTRCDVSLADLLSASAEAAAEEAPAETPVADESLWEELEDTSPPRVDTRLEPAIRRAYCDSSGGHWNVRVRLADLRRRLTGVPREEVDAALLALQAAGALTLYALDNPGEIRPEDQAAALDLGLDQRHILYMGERS